MRVSRGLEVDDMVCRVWDMHTGKLVHELRGHKGNTPPPYPSMVSGGAFFADGKDPATGTRWGTSSSGTHSMK